MKIFKLTISFIVFLSMNGFAQNLFPVKFRVEKQSMSTPMSPLDEIFFNRSYYSRPVTVEFDGNLLCMYYDNGATFAKKQVTKIDVEQEFEDDNLILEKFFYVDNSNVKDTIMFVVDYDVSYIQMILPTKGKTDNYFGYTSYRKFVKEDGFASN